MAVLMLGLMATLIACGIGSWFIFAQSDKLAAGSLKSQYIPVIEQSMLDPQTKEAAVRQLKSLASQLETDQWEPAQARELMKRLIGAPLVQWGDLDAAIAQIESRDAFNEDERQQAKKLIERFKRAAELEAVSANDFEDALGPVTVKDQSLRGCHFHVGASDEALREFLKRIGLLVERAKVPDEAFNVSFSDILRMHIENAREVD